MFPTKSLPHLLPDHERHGSHDRRAAGLKAKQASPWRHGNVDTPNTRRIRAKWNAEGTRRK
jgi:hypothetical protein